MSITMRLLRFTLLSILFSHVIPALAFNPAATDAAFAALLSMPSAKSETGNWTFPVPVDFRGKSESELITYLAKQQARGADFNAYRHFGTLLHHAIRAKLTKTAFWLLDHGANPRKKLLNGTDDALSLSLQYKQNTLLTALVEKHGLVPPKITSKPEPVLSHSEKALDRTGLDKLRRAQSVAHEYANKPQAMEKIVPALAEWESAAQTIPDDQYIAQMDYDDSLVMLIQAYSKTPQALEKSLSRIPPAVLERHSTALVAALSTMSALREWREGPPQYSVPEESWRVLWRKLKKPLVYKYDNQVTTYVHHTKQISTLAGRIQPTLWDELYATGYDEQHAEIALGCMLNIIDPTSFKALWPTLPKFFPNINEVAPAMLLAGYRLRQEEVGFCRHPENGLVEKLLFLTSLGHVKPIKGIDPSTTQYISKELSKAMTPYLKPSTILASMPRFVKTSPRCEFTLTPLLFKKLTDKPIVEDDGYSDVYIESIQLVEVPNSASCGVLLGGGSRVEYYPQGETDSFTGPTNEPRASCPDPTDRYAIWLERNGMIEQYTVALGGEDNNGGLTLVRDQKTGAHYYWNSGEQLGMCHMQSPKRLPLLLAWTESKNGWELKRVSSLGLSDALYDQCVIEQDAVQCRGISNLTDTDSVNTPAWDVQHDLMGFLKTYRRAENEAYLNAVMDLDKTKLSKLRNENVPGQWVAEAIVKVGESKLPLKEKRKRIAWLFYDHTHLEKALAQYLRPYPGYDVLSSLAMWLPEEDWQPILNIVAKYGSYQDYGLGYIRDNVVDRGMEKLACAIDNARGFICGETWSSSATE